MKDFFFFLLFSCFPPSKHVLPFFDKDANEWKCKEKGNDGVNEEEEREGEKEKVVDVAKMF